MPHIGHSIAQRKALVAKLTSATPGQLNAHVEGVLRERHKGRWAHLSDDELYRLLARRIRHLGTIPAPAPREVVYETQRVLCRGCGRAYKTTSSGRMRMHSIEPGLAGAWCPGAGVQVFSSG